MQARLDNLDKEVKLVFFFRFYKTVRASTIIGGVRIRWNFAISVFKNTVVGLWWYLTTYYVVFALERVQTYCSRRQIRIIIGPTWVLIKPALLCLWLVCFVGCAPYNWLKLFIHTVALVMSSSASLRVFCISCWSQQTGQLSAGWAATGLLHHPACLCHLTSTETLQLWQPVVGLITGRETMARNPLHRLGCWLIVLTNQPLENINVSLLTPDNHWKYSWK